MLVVRACVAIWQYCHLALLPSIDSVVQAVDRRIAASNSHKEHSGTERMCLSALHGAPFDGPALYMAISGSTTRTTATQLATSLRTITAAAAVVVLLSALFC